MSQPSPPVPLAPLADPAAFVKAMAKVQSALAKDLVARAKDPRIEPSLKATHAAEKKAELTGADYPSWRQSFCDQVSASWVLCTVFVRTLEDRGFLPHRVAGPGASDRRDQFRAQFRFLTDRDYLQHIFDALSLQPAGAEVFGQQHAPLWRLSPSQGALSELLDALRATGDDGQLVYSFGQPATGPGADDAGGDDALDREGASTRFLGDLYQDLNEGVRKRYALLQTPDFVESFILDQTLTPAMAERGVAVTVLDPTCGSGHFLLGAYDRLFDAQRKKEPGRKPEETARQALSQVYGVDLNPYAAAIARFRLLLAYLDKSGLSSLDAVSESLPIQVFIGDSLLAGKLGSDSGVGQQFTFGDSLEKEGKDADAAGFQRGLGYSLLDPKTDALLKSTRFDVVVGNPPYITEKDAKKREKIREAFPRSAYREFSLAAPFVERIFILANEGGWTGQITANSFMKREFGRAVIENVVPTVDLSLIVDTSGAYIPGHGTPTVLLFGRNQRPVTDSAAVVMGNRGEPSTPADASKGRVWTSIATHSRDLGYEDDYITVGARDRKLLARHPWSLAGGGAGQLKALLEERAATTLGELVDSVGFGLITKADDIFALPNGCLQRNGVHNHVRNFGKGDVVRNWACENDEEVFFPYDDAIDLLVPADLSPELRFFWPWRTTLFARKVFGGQTCRDVGKPWYSFGQIPRDRYSTPLSITFAFVATHNHFVLDRGGKVFNRTAPIIKLPESATEDDHLALLGYLNSSVACFWMKQVMMNKGATSDAGVLQADPEKFRFEFDGTKVKATPLPSLEDLRRLLPFSRQLTALGEQLGRNEFQALVAGTSWESVGELSVAINELRRQRTETLLRAVAVQEELDWAVYALFRLPGSEDVSSDTKTGGDKGLAVPDAREVENRPYRFKDQDGASALGPIDQARLEVLRNHKLLKVLESPEYKRRWYRSKGKFNAENVNDDDLLSEALLNATLSSLERYFRSADGAAAVPLRELAQGVGRSQRNLAIAEFLTGSATFDLEELLGELMLKEAVPSATCQLYTDSGIDKRRLWEHTWDLQRREDAGEDVGDIAVPPKYKQTDFENSSVTWRHRGKLDVPKERFIAYPSATPPPGAKGKAGLVFGWAGWNHLEQLQAATALWQEEWELWGDKVLPRSARKARTESLERGELGATAADANPDSDQKLKDDEQARQVLLPILQTMVDLLPWVRQWHNDDGETAQAYEAYVETECRKVDMSTEEVHLFRLPKKAKGRRRASGSGGGSGGGRAKKTKVTVTEEMVTEAVGALDEGEGAKVTEVRKRLGASAAALKKVLEPMLERGALTEVKKRPRLVRLG